MSDMDYYLRILGTSIHDRLVYAWRSLKTWEGWASLAIAILMLGVFLFAFQVIGLVLGPSPSSASAFMEPVGISATESPPDYTADTYAVPDYSRMPNVVPPPYEMELGESWVRCDLAERSSIVLPSDSVLRCDYRIAIWPGELAQYIRDDALVNESGTGVVADQENSEDQSPPLLDYDSLLDDMTNVTWMNLRNGGTYAVEPEITSVEPLSVDTQGATIEGGFIVTAPPTSGRFELSLELSDTPITRYRNAQPATSRLKVLSISELVVPLQVLIVIGLEVSLFKLLLDLLKRVDEKLA